MGLLLSLNPGAGISENDAKLKWEKATDWGITDWYATNDELTIVIRNNTTNTLTLDFVNINDTNNNAIPQGDNIFSAGQEKVLTFGKLCSSSYVYNKVEINYSTSLTTGRKQFAVAPIVGKCSS